MSSLTPTNPRVMNPAWAPKLTPSNSPYLKTPSARAPHKSTRPDLNLSLTRVIGTTTSNANAFASLPSARSFAYTAGAAAVIATLEDDQHVSQRFYRARPTTAPINPPTSIYGPTTPTHNAPESRSRTAASLRDIGTGASPFGSGAGDYDSGGKSWSARERIKAATCVSLSGDGKYLAVGETGYKPRVLIFASSKDAPSDIPLTSLSEHTFGVTCVAFSPDSQYLASLGSSNDGFLYIWNIHSRNGAATLFASNKCTSNINRMAWLGNSLVTVGTRHVKVWRVEELMPSQSGKPRSTEASLLSTCTNRTLPGRNCLLGPLIEASFTCVVAIAPRKAIICSDKGDICLLDDSDGNQRFLKIADAGFSISAVATDSNGNVHFAGAHGGVSTMKSSDLLAVNTPPPSPPPRADSPGLPPDKHADYYEVMMPLGDHLMAVDSKHVIRIFALDSADEASALGHVVQKLSAHGDAVLGVRATSPDNPYDAAFFTWCASGSAMFWGRDGMLKGEVQIPLEQIEGLEEGPNEVKVLRASSKLDFLVSGDKYGVLRILDGETKQSIFNIKAHTNEITDITIFEGEATYVACAARDRMIQVFQRRNQEWQLLQTLDEHVGAVTGLLFTPNGNQLVSCSSDRTIVVREAVTREDNGETETAFLIARTITLKASAVSMIMDVHQEDIILASTIDRHVHKFDLRNGQNISSFRALDADGGDAVVMCSLAHVPTARGSPLIAGVSSTDKSIRVYEENGTFQARDWGHTEGVRDIAYVPSPKMGQDQEQKLLVTVAVDGTIFLWNLDLRPPHRQAQPVTNSNANSELSKSMDLMGVNASTTKNGADLLASRPPLRRVLSQSELSRFQRPGSPTDDRGDQTPTPPTKHSDHTFGPNGAAPLKSPRLKKKTSRLALQAPKLDPPFSSRAAANSNNANAPSYAEPTGKERRFQHQHQHQRRGTRSPSPPLPPSSSSPRHARALGRKKSDHALGRGGRAAQTHGSTASDQSNGSSSTATSTHTASSSKQVDSVDSLLRCLRGFRKRMAEVPMAVTADQAGLVEQELLLTARVVRERGRRVRARGSSSPPPPPPPVSAAAAAAAADEVDVERLLDGWSDRLVERLDSRIRGMVEREVGLRVAAGLGEEGGCAACPVGRRGSGGSRGGSVTSAEGEESVGGAEREEEKKLQGGPDD